MSDMTPKKAFIAVVFNINQTVHVLSDNGLK